jgi:hypothetical protein
MKRQRAWSSEHGAEGRERSEIRDQRSGRGKRQRAWSSEHEEEIRIFQACMKFQTNGVTVPSIDQRSSLRAKRSNLSEKPLARDCFGEDASQ